MSKKNVQRKPGGISAYAIFVPAAVTLAVLHVFIVILILQIGSSSSTLSETMRDSARNTREATSLLAGSSLLSEVSGMYILMPLDEMGEPNIGPLTGYAQELGVDRRGDQVLERMRGYGIPPESLAQMEIAANCANAMLADQLHAIALIRSVYPLPELPPLAAIPRVELSEEEQAMSPREREAAARALILNAGYGENKRLVSQNVNGFVEEMQASSARQQAMSAARIGKLRILLWAVTLLVMLILFCVFVTLDIEVMKPLRHFVRLLPTDSPLDERHGFREVQMVASSYNGVLHRRDALDDILHSAAEKDALTGLPNRFRFEQYLLETEDSEEPAALLLFDINYLKRTNDTLGHLAGDRLIRDSADCIASCFDSDGNCFRYGGDEFVAVVRPGTPDTIRPRITRFEAMEAERDISISWGCAYTARLSRENLRALLDEADRQMYSRKKEAHNCA